MLFSSISSSLILKLAVFAALNGFNSCNLIVTDQTVCDAPAEFKIIYIKEFKNGEIEVIKENGEIKRMNSYFLEE